MPPENNSIFMQTGICWITVSLVPLHLGVNSCRIVQPKFPTASGFFKNALSHRMPVDEQIKILHIPIDQLLCRNVQPDATVNPKAELFVREINVTEDFIYFRISVRIAKAGFQWLRLPFVEFSLWFKEGDMIALFDNLGL